MGATPLLPPYVATMKTIDGSSSVSMTSGDREDVADLQDCLKLSMDEGEVDAFNDNEDDDAAW
jgi:hypothetical protein